MKNGFFRGHGLGNDYLVVDPHEMTFKLTPKHIKAICDRNWGVGSDGILALVPSKKADFGLRIFNPDGSEAEKSGNGLRIFARYLHAWENEEEALHSRDKGGLVRISACRPTWRCSRRDRQWGSPRSTERSPCSLEVPELIQQPISRRTDRPLPA